MYDAIICGARVAGAPTAMLLARKGYRVLLLDRASFPSDTLSTHLIHQPGIARLKRWGLLPRLEATGCPPITLATLDAGDIAITGSAPAYEGVAVAYSPRRYILDDLLVQAAVESGAELRERFSVQKLLIEDGRVVGVRGRGADGIAVTERAHIVIGADGRNSFVAKAAGAATYHEVPAQTCGYYSYWSGVPLSGMEVFPRDGCFIGAFPTHNDQACIFVMWRQGEFARFRSDIEGGFMRTLELAPEFAARVRAGRRVERWMGSAGSPSYFRVPHGRGWALVGDAGYAKDPISGFGITDSFRDAELLVDAVDAGLSGREPMNEALAVYQQRRDAFALPLYQSTCESAELNPVTPQLKQFLAALRLDPEQTSRFFGIIAGTVRGEEFFTPENITQILANAQEAVQQAA